MRKNRWIIYDTTTGVYPLNIVARSRTRRAGQKILKALREMGDCVHLAYVEPIHAKPYTADHERPIDRAFRHKFGLQMPVPTGVHA